MKYDGKFSLKDIEVIGHVKIRNNNSVTLLTGDARNFPDNFPRDLHGNLTDGQKISLLECSCVRSTEFMGGEIPGKEAEIYSRFVSIGHEHISSQDAKIETLTYRCEDAHLFCEDLDTFGLLLPDRVALGAFLEAEHDCLSNQMADRGWGPRRRKKKLGRNPTVALYDGNQEIAEAVFPDGKLWISNCASFGLGSAKGVEIKNSILHTIDFHEPQTLSKALQNLRVIHQFYELLLGRRQKYIDISIQINGAGERRDTPISLFWNRCNTRVKKRRSEVDYRDVPFLASTDRELFQKVLTNWISTSPNMMSSRTRLLDGLLTNTHSYDRLIGAANMYDLLPKGKVPQVEDLNHELLSAVADTRATFKKLESSSARESVLSVLG